MTTTLIVARHGNTFGPAEIVTRVGGRTDLPLVQSGLEQGRKMGSYLRAHSLLPDAVYASELKRTVQTAQAALDAADIQRNIECLSLFNEIDYGPDENKPEVEVLARVGEKALKDWDENAIVPNGWNFNPKEAINNWINFGSQLVQKHENKIILAVTSNGIARFSPYLTGDFEAFRKQHKIKISTGALCLFTHTGEKWSVEGWNLKP